MRFKWLQTTVLFYIALGLIGIGLPLSRPLVSIGQILLILDGLVYFRSYDYKKIAFSVGIIPVLLFIIHLLGLIHTTNYAYAFHDIRIKLPLLIIPLFVFSKKNIRFDYLKYVLYIWIISLTISSISGAAYYFFYLPEYADFRKLSPFISHIRMSLMINAAIVFLWYNRKELSKKWRVVVELIMIWFVIYLLLLQSLNGIIILLVIVVLIIEKQLFLYSRKFFYTFNIILLLVGLLAVKFIDRYYEKNFVLPENYFAFLPVETVNHHPYDLPVNQWETENGNAVYALICNKELYENWHKYSNIPLDSFDYQHQKMYYTLIRYMTSKGLSKDSLGLTKLSKEDIRAIENGIANYKFTEQPLSKRIYITLWEYHTYKNGGYIGKSSTVRRWLFWQTAFSIIKNHLWAGVGTGDVADAYREAYDKNPRGLLPEDQKRAHNQIITFFVSFGVIGGMICLILLLVPLFKAPHFAFTLFYVIALLSFITEDTLETQIGATFFSYLFSVFYFIRRPQG